MVENIMHARLQNGMKDGFYHYSSDGLGSP